MGNVIERAKEALAHYDLPVDCDCNDDDCMKCSHYPTFHMAAAKTIKDMAPDLARIAIAAEGLADACDAMADLTNSGICDEALAAFRAALAASE